MTCRQHCREFNNLQNMSRSSNSPASDDPDFFFRQATLARMISEPSPQPDSVNRTPNLAGTSKGAMESNPNNSLGSSRATRLVSHSGTVIFLKPPVHIQMEERCMSVDGDGEIFTCRDKMEGFDQDCDSQSRRENAPSSSAPQISHEQRKVAGNNGCVSAANMEKTDITLDDGDECQIVANIVDDGVRYRDKGKGIVIHKGSQPRTGNRRLVRNGCISQNSYNTHQVCNSTPDSEENNCDKKKMIVDVDEETGGRHSNRSSRACNSLGKEVTVIEGVEADTVKGKRKYSLTRSGECSGSASDYSISYAQLSSQPSNSMSTIDLKHSHHGITLGPVIKVDSNPLEQCSRVSNARERQVEQDEMLARQLQEKYYNESPVFGGREEIDAATAWSLQEEDDRLSIYGESQIDGMGASRRQSSARQRNFSARSNRGQHLTPSRMTQLRREFHRSRLEPLGLMRPHLESMEVAPRNVDGMTITNRVLRVHRDFNENDYEMLVALDDDNQHGGASEGQINNLPQSVVQSDSTEEPCVVCLESPVAGDIIRHLPCLHKFHKECINTWLRRRRSCPICKSGIT